MCSSLVGQLVGCSIAIDVTQSDKALIQSPVSSCLIVPLLQVRGHPLDIEDACNFNTLVAKVPDEVPEAHPQVHVRPVREGLVSIDKAVAASPPAAPPPGRAGAFSIIMAQPSMLLNALRAAFRPPRELSCERSSTLSER